MAQQYTYKVVMAGGSGQEQIAVSSGYKFVSIINGTPDTVQLHEGQKLYADADVRDAIIELQPYSSMTVPLGDYRSYFTLVYFEGVVGDPPHVCNVIFSVDNLGITGPVGSPGNTNNVNITGDGAGLAKSNQLPQNLISGALATYIANTVAVTLASLPPLAAGTNNIGDVDVLTLPPITGTVGVSSLPSISGTVVVSNQPTGFATSAKQDALLTALGPLATNAGQVQTVDTLTDILSAIGVTNARMQTLINLQTTANGLLQQLVDLNTPPVTP